MKTLTELSGTLVRTAAAAVAEARRDLPKGEAREGAPPAAPRDVEPVGPGTAAAAPGVAEAGAAAAEPAPGAAPAPDPADAALDAAVARATGLSGDRLAMLRAAVEAVGPRAADVRLVRVFPGDAQLPGATSIRGHQYVIDYFPASMKQEAGGGREERGRRGGGRRAGGGGGRGGGGKGAATTGGFSMDAVREDRRNERGGRGRPSGPRRPGGTPKK